MVEGVYVHTHRPYVSFVVSLAILLRSGVDFNLSQALMSARGSSTAPTGFPSPSYIFSTLLTLEHATNTAHRLLRETGRLSSTPIFVVGVFTGKDKLGEGFGSSLKMAEYRVRLKRPCPSPQYPSSSPRGFVT
jgi:dsRNA-specific ribonuclease